MRTAKLIRTLIAFAIGFGLGCIGVLINGEFVIHVPVVLGIIAAVIYLSKEQIWGIWP